MGSTEDDRRRLLDRIESKCWECRAQDEGVKSEETGLRYHLTPRGRVECPASSLRDELDALSLGTGTGE
jgi:hypothetical protein